MKKLVILIIGFALILFMLNFAPVSASVLRVYGSCEMEGRGTNAGESINAYRSGWWDYAYDKEQGLWYNSKDFPLDFDFSYWQNPFIPFSGKINNIPSGGYFIDYFGSSYNPNNKPEDPYFVNDCSEGCSETDSNGIYTGNANLGGDGWGFLRYGCMDQACNPWLETWEAIKPLEECEGLHTITYTKQSSFRVPADIFCSGRLKYTEEWPEDSAEPRKCFCNRDSALNSKFSVDINAVDDINLLSPPAQDNPNPKEVYLKEKKDISFSIETESSIYNIKELTGSEPVNEKYNCSLPESFTIKITLGGMYYDYFVIDINDILKEERKKINGISSKLNYFIQENGLNINDYFLSDDEIYKEMIGHHISLLPFISADDSVFIEETITINIDFITNDQINIEITDYASATPRSLSVYAGDYKLGNLKQKQVKSGSFTISKGASSIFIYEGLLRKIAKSVVEIKNQKEFNEPVVAKPIIINNKSMGYLHTYPSMIEDNLDNLRDFELTSSGCCMRNSYLEIPEVKIENCPSKISQIKGTANVKIDAGLIKAGMDFLDSKEDGSFYFQLSLDNMDYDPSSKNLFYSLFQCGTPKKAVFKAFIKGNYYDDFLPNLVGEENINFYGGLRESFLENFPPSEIKYFFESQGEKIPIYEQSKVLDLIDLGDVVDPLWGNIITDDSQQVSEFIYLTLEKMDDGRLNLTLSDLIVSRPLPERHSVTDVLSPSYPFGIKPLQKSVIISEQEPGTSIFFSGMVNSLASSVYNFRNNPKFTAPYDIPKSGQIIHVVPDSQFDLDDLAWYLSARKSNKCCFSGKVSDTGAVSGPGLSVYFLRDPDNFEIPGEAYLVSANKEVTAEVSKSITGPSNMALFKLDDSQLNYCNYSILCESEEVLNAGTYYSCDSQFELSLNENINANINIKKININHCWNYNLSEFNVIEQEETSYEDMILFDILSSLKAVINNEEDYLDTLFKIELWKLS